MILVWSGFLIFVLTVLALDLGVLNERPHAPSMKEALTFTAMTVLLALAFTAFIYSAYQNHWAGLGSTVDRVDRQLNDGRLATVKFITGYIVELSLSMDNVFVIALIFEHFKVPQALQHRVLFWGILGALAMRGAMIGGGAALVSRYEWILYLFGVFLVFTALRMLFVKATAAVPEESFVVRWLNRRFRVTQEFHGMRFRLTKGGKTFITPLMVALVLVETTDVIFAVDSIPAIFAITTDAFIVFTSNVFAILCLRSLYFGLARLLEKFRYLKVSLALILGLVGMKMLTTRWTGAWLGAGANFWTLGIVATVLAMGAMASIVVDRRTRRHHRTP